MNNSDMAPLPSYISRLQHYPRGLPACLLPLPSRVWPSLRLSKRPPFDHFISLSLSFFFFFFLAMLRGMRDLSSLTRERTHAPCSGSTEAWSLNHWTAREVLLLLFLSLFISFSYSQYRFFLLLPPLTLFLSFLFPPILSLSLTLSIHS